MKPGAFKFLHDHLGKEITASPSAYMNWLKPKMRVVEQGRLVFEYQIRTEMTNPFGTLHGGVISSIIDDAIGATLIAYEESVFYVSINLSVDFFANARAGETILAETKINKKGKTIVNAECEIWNEDKSKLLAKGYTNLLKTAQK